MKKGFAKTFLVSILMAFIFAFSACNNGPNIYVDSYTVTTENEALTHYVDDEFSLEGYVLTLAMTDGTVKKIELEDSMIKTKPDMKTIGKKNVSFEYNGETYSFSVYVDAKEKKEFIQKLYKTLLNFSNLNNLPAEIVIGTSTKYSASYLGNTINSETYESEVTLAPDMLIVGYNSDGEPLGLVFPDDPLAQFTYLAFLNNFVANSLTPGNDDIIDVNEQTIKFNFQEYVLDFFIDMVGFDFIKYIFQNYLFVGEKLEYIESVTYFLSEYLFIDIVYDEGDDADKVEKAQYDLQNFSTGVVTKFIDCEFEKINIKDEIIKLSKIVNDHSADEIIKLLIKNAALASTGYDCTLDKIVNEDVDEKHILSSFISYFSDIYQVYKTNSDGSISLDDSEEAREYANQYVLNVSNIIRSIEDYITQSFEAALKEEPFATQDMLKNIKTATDEYINHITENTEANGWVVSETEEKIIYVLSMFGEAVDLYDDNPRIYLMNVLERFNVFEGILSCIAYDGLTEEHRQLIANMLYDILKPNPNYDYKNYIRSICGMVEIYDEEIIQDYIDQFEKTKTFTILSDYFGSQLELMRDPNNQKMFITQIAEEKRISNADAVIFFEHRIEAFDELLNAVRYMENIPINGYEPIVLTTYISSMLENINNGYIDDDNTQMLIQVVMQFLNIEETFKTNLRDVISIYKVEISNMLTSLITGLLDISDYSSVPYKEMQTIISYAVSEYANGTMDFTSIMNSFFKTVNTYCNEDKKVFANSLGMLLAIVIGKDSDVKIDYNKLFEYIELPNAVNKVDYNELVKKLWDDATYNNIFTISNPIIKFVSDEEGVILGEVVTFTLKIDFDIVISSFNAEMVCVFAIPFNN